MSEKYASFPDFTQLDIRVGTVLAAEEFPEVKKPAYQLKIDFGAYGIKKTSAQITDHYKPQDLIHKQVIAIINFPPKQIANMMSECLVLGVVGNEGAVVLLRPDQPVENGLKIS